MPQKNKPRRTPARVGAPSGIFLQISRGECLRMNSADHSAAANICAVAMSPLEIQVCVHWSSPEHLLCDAAALYPSHIDILLDPGVVDEAISLADAGALAEFYYACDRLTEFDALVIENLRARDHILSLYPPPGCLDRDLVTPAQRRVRAVVAAAAARRAIEEICNGCC